MFRVREEESLVNDRIVAYRISQCLHQYWLVQVLVKMEAFYRALEKTYMGNTGS